MDGQPVISAILKAVERKVVEGEWQLSRQEARLVMLKQRNLDMSEALSALRMMLDEQQLHQAERLRLLRLLEPKELKPRGIVDPLLPVTSPQTPAGSKPQMLVASAHSAEGVS